MPMKSAMYLKTEWLRMRPASSRFLETVDSELPEATSNSTTVVSLASTGAKNIASIFLYPV